MKPPRKNPDPRRVYVYLLRQGERWKIGKSRSPYVRAIGIKKDAEGRRPEVFHAIETVNAEWLEKRLHAAFDSCSLGGEWFALSPADVRLLVSLKACHGEDDVPMWLRGRGEEAVQRRVMKWLTWGAKKTSRPAPCLLEQAVRDLFFALGICPDKAGWAAGPPSAWPRETQRRLRTRKR